MIFKVFLIFPDPQRAYPLTELILETHGYQVEILRDFDEFKNRPQIELPCAVIVDENVNQEQAQQFILTNPAIAVLYHSSRDKSQSALDAIERGYRGVLNTPTAADEIVEKLNLAGQFQHNLEKWVIKETHRNTRTLQKRIDDLERLSQISKQITASLQLEVILKEVVRAATELTAAEEAQLLLLEQPSGELVLRSSFSRDQGQTRLLRLPVHDTLIGDVLEEKKPILYNGDELKKIQTAFLVRSLLFVPLLLEDEAVGVLGVINRRQSHMFQDYERTLLEALANFAVIAIHNAHLYHANETEREKLQTILNQIQDAVIVLDNSQKVLLINKTAKTAFNLSELSYLGIPFAQIVHNPELNLILQQTPEQLEKWHEVHFEQGEVWNCRVTPISDVGTVITLHEITHFKELDRQKTEFVNSVSHDLRSPLTAILGYTELLKRMGELNQRQHEYIYRIQMSVQNITALINDLLDLSRIEAGMDTHKEPIQLPELIQNALEEVSPQANQKGIRINVEVQTDLPQILGNAIRIRQCITNLITNALKYTSTGGKVGIRAWNEQGQVIIQVWDNGIGIPLSDQAHIFDKFFRGSNLPESESGTGLGLTIVKSIVDDHHGRIWVDSKEGEGTTFTVVFPSA
ncbi:MAG: ATP-binding protein [Anaerolineales bacterium]